MFYLQNTRFLCNLCGDQYFKIRNDVHRHIEEQHSGFSYKCNLCHKAYIRNGNHARCNGSKWDMVLFHRESGARDSEAQVKLEELYRDRSLICGRQYLFLLSIIQQTTGPRKSHPWPRPTSTARAPLPMRNAVSKPLPSQSRPQSMMTSLNQLTQTSKSCIQLRNVTQIQIQTLRM